MRLHHPGTGTRLSVPDRMVGRYLAQGWVQAGGYTAAEFTEPRQDGGDPGGDGSGQQPPPEVVTLTGATTGGVPDGTATDVIRWVGDDPARARQALDAEQAKGDDARSTLVAKLGKLAGQQ